MSKLSPIPIENGRQKVKENAQANLEKEPKNKI